MPPGSPTYSNYPHNTGGGSGGISDRAIPIPVNTSYFKDSQHFALGRVADDVDGTFLGVATMEAGAAGELGWGFSP